MTSDAPPFQDSPMGRERIVAEAMIPSVLRAHPALRAVFDRYGLRGCGGLDGPAESVAYFARVHGVPEAQLLAELNSALNHPPAGADASGADDSDAAASRRRMEQLADTIYRRFFKAGIVVVLTAGAAWGAYLLLQIAGRGRFTAVSIHDINAHGHAQIFGWMGLFVMGFAYQAFPRMKHTDLWRPDLANATFYLMVLGIFVRTLAEPLHELPMMRELAMAASMAEIAAVVLFVTIVVRTLLISGKPFDVNDYYILAALGFFAVQAFAEAGLLYATLAAEDGGAVTAVVATYQGALRDLQIHGFGLLIILGVGLRMFPLLFGLHRPGQTLQWVALPLLVVAVACEVLSHIMFRSTGNRLWVLPLLTATFLLAAGSMTLTFRWGLLARPSEEDRSTKFVRAAVFWLHVSMLLLVMAPIYQRIVLANSPVLSASGEQSLAMGFSHAYHGAVRHAITVGFISLMILGMAGKVVPTLNGVDIRRLRPLWLPFVLVNLGCAWRVSLQIGTDFTAWAYPAVGLSGLIEVSGIAIWGIHLWRIMDGWRPAEDRAAETGPPPRIVADHRVGQILDWYPTTLDLLISRGFTPLANPLLRQTVARAVSLRTAAARQNIDLEALLAELNKEISGMPRRSATDH